MRLSSILNLGPFSADIDYSKIKDKIKVEEKARTVFKDAMDNERLAYKLGYAKDGLNMDVSTNKDLNNLQFSLKKTLTKEPERIFAKKAKGGLAGILRI
jgi:translation elongation factor EF-1beta